MRNSLKEFNASDLLCDYKKHKKNVDSFCYVETDKKYTKKDGGIKEFCINITDLVQQETDKLGIQNGFVLCFTKHTTSGIVVNHFEKGLISDIFEMLHSKYPQKNYMHDKWEEASNNKNATAHLMSMHIGKSCVINISGGKHTLGEYDQILYFEFDARDNKTFCISIFGE